MTYLELIAKHKDNPSTLAVVKLHLPKMGPTGGYSYYDEPLFAELCTECSNNGFTQEYPCPTIIAVIKGVK
jgi:hypothetical protein